MTQPEVVSSIVQRYSSSWQRSMVCEPLHVADSPVLRCIINHPMVPHRFDSKETPAGLIGDDSLLPEVQPDRMVHAATGRNKLKKVRALCLRH